VSTRRLLASAALLLLVVAAVLAIGLAISRFPRGLSVFVCFGLAVLAAWYAVRRRGTARTLWACAAAVLLARAVALIIFEGKPLLSALVLVCLAGAVAAARAAFRVHVELPRAAPPERAVLFYNPLSGGGKAERFHLADEARKRGIEPIELRRGDDLEQLVRGGVARSRRSGDGRW